MVQVPRAEVPAWLAVDDSCTGFDPSGWEATTWILHAMYRLPRGAESATDPRPESNTDDGGHVTSDVLTSDPLGDVEWTDDIGWGLQMTLPLPGSERLRWRTIGADRGGSYEGRPVPPSFRWFRTVSLPDDIEPPCEGSLDEDSLTHLLAVLVRHTAGGADARCFAYYAPLSGGGWDEQAVYEGPLAAIPSMVGDGGYRRTPSNIWPTDHSWLVYTDSDLWGTKVSGRRDLVTALEADDVLETITLDLPPEP